jgi:hypothetical protein
MKQGKSQFKQAMDSLIESSIAMEEFEKKFNDSKTLVNDNLEQVERILLKTKRDPENNFNEVLVYDWIDGWNYFKHEGFVYTFRFYPDDHSISGLAPIKIVEIIEEEETNA